jgi:hypothetical protein
MTSKDSANLIVEQLKNSANKIDFDIPKLSSDDDSVDSYQTRFKLLLFVLL